MNTKIDTDESIIKEVMVLGNFKTIEEAVNTYLPIYFNELQREQLLKMKWKVVWDGNLKQKRSI